MESSTLEEFVHALATTQQNQPQGLVVIHHEHIQEQHFKVLLQAQQEYCHVLLQLITPTGVPATKSVGFPHVTLTKTGPHDNPEAFGLPSAL